MKNKKPFFKASVTNNTLEMMVYEEIGNDGMGGGVTAANVKKQIDNAGAYDSIKIRINSPGGDAFEGIAIGNLLKSTKKPIQVCIDGIAASSASIIAMAGDTITMGSNAIMMIHNAWSLAIGDSAELRKMADTLDKVSASIAQTYVDKTGKSLAEVKAMMDAETWMSAQDCVDNKFADSIAGSDDDAMAFAKGFKFKNVKAVPTQLKNEDVMDACACDCMNCVANDCMNCMNSMCDDPNCVGCPYQQANTDQPDEPSNLSQYEARLKLISLYK